MDGVILIDKPVGPTSFDVVRKVRKFAQVKRVGHAGTLDPLASGLMVVCIGRYTKFAGLLTAENKIYDATFKLGETTNTDDREGEIIDQRDCRHISAAHIENALSKFIGRFGQTPPRFSAIKVNGQRAYNLARSEVNFELSRREIEIFSITDVKYVHPLVSLRVHCSKGTYIRSLARDLGDQLQVGAHATAIKRISSGRFTIEQACSLDELNEQNFFEKILKGPSIFAGLTVMPIGKTERNELRFGRNPFADAVLNDPVIVAIYEDEPIAILENVNGRMQIGRII